MDSCCVDCPFKEIPRLPVDSDVFRPIRNKGQNKITPFYRAYTRLRFIADNTLTFHMTWCVPVTVHKVPMEAETGIIEYMGSYFEPWKRCGVTIKAWKKGFHKQVRIEIVVPFHLFHNLFLFGRLQSCRSGRRIALERITWSAKTIILVSENQEHAKRIERIT